MYIKIFLGGYDHRRILLNLWKRNGSTDVLEREIIMINEGFLKTSRDTMISRMKYNAHNIYKE